MREFAARTHQPTAELRAGDAAPARDFIAASIDTAAMPVRVEKWLVGGRLEYRITGIIWGGSEADQRAVDPVQDRRALAAGRRLPAAGVDADLEPVVAHLAPSAPGRYQIVLKVNDPTIRTRRLDLFFYVREIEIDDV